MLLVALAHGLGFVSTHGAHRPSSTPVCRRRCTARAREGGPSPDEREVSSGGFFAAYDEADLQALWEVHSAHFGDTSAVPSSADADATREETPLNGLHEAVLRALEEGDDADSGTE